MSNIDLKRLAEDREYWDEKAGTASHYCPSNRQFYDARLHSCCIPRPPQKAQEVEWTDGLAGYECECQSSRLGSAVWERCKVIGPNGRFIVCLLIESGGFQQFEPRHLRPIRTKDQRLRDELAELIGEHQELSGSFVTPENTADAILSRYNLEPKP